MLSPGGLCHFFLTYTYNRSTVFSIIKTKYVHQEKKQETLQSKSTNASSGNHCMHPDYGLTKM